VLELTELRSLEAIQLATAALLEDTLARFVCYNDRMSQAAQSLGWTVAAPR